MEKAPIKKFAVEARRKLIADVTFQLERYGITEKGIVEPQTSTDKELVFDLGNGNTQTIKGERYVNQYRNLIAHVRGFYADGSPKQQLEQFIEEIAFTWFNRLIAIRFMEVNRYIPVRVLSSEIEGQKLPDLVASPFSGDLEFTDAEKQHIFDLQDANKEDDLFRFLFFKQCNDLSRILPRLFENLEGHNSFSELLVALSFNDPNGVVYHLVNDVEEPWFDIHAVDEDGKPMGQVQIIGWMYQYYNTDPKEQVFKDLKKNIKISKQNIPAATQLFTPDWIVRSILENNLFGLDIDKRAAQIAYFSVMMKAREYDSGFLTRTRKDGSPDIPQLYVYQVLESAYTDKKGNLQPNYSMGAVKAYGAEDSYYKNALDGVLRSLVDAGEYGSLTKTFDLDWKKVFERFAQLKEHSLYNAELEELREIVTISQLLGQKYDVVVTNPPYMGSSGMDGTLANYIKTNYPDSKSDLFAAFIEACTRMTKPNGYQAMITQHAWMFLSSYEKLREKMMLTETVNMAHLGARAFEEIGGEVVQTTSFVRCRTHIDGYKGTYCRLIEPTSQQGKEDMFLAGENRYFVNQDNFAKIPGSPVAYWASTRALENYVCMGSVSDMGEGRIGLITGDANRFLRLWSEVDFKRIGFDIHSNEESVKSGLKWFPTQKGGDFRKWYGNLDYIVNWENDGYEMKYDNYMGKRVRSHNYNGDLGFKKAITWTTISSGNFACRFSGDGFIYDTAGPFFHVTDDRKLYMLLAFLDSKVANFYLKIMNPTINFPPGYIQAIPFSKECQTEQIENLSKSCTDMSKNEWDAFETSWDFKKHPLV